MKKLKLFFVIATLTLCGTAQAQRSLDLGKLFDAGKSVAAATTGISEKEEIEIGRGLAGRMLGQVELVDDANVQAYVNRVGRWIASQSERPDLPWRFGVANAPNINAMAMPGGTILITRGLYDILDNEAQLAGVLGHEIAHVVKKHHIGVMQKQNLVSAGASLVASRTGNNQLGQVALNFFKNLFISGLDKESEYEADAVGVILAARAGYNAFGLAEVLHKLNSRGASDPSVVDLFGSHPGPTDRLGRLGDLLTPRLPKLPAGLEPELTAVSTGASAPSRAGKPAARAATPPARAATPPVGARALVSESPAAEETPTEAAPAPAQKPAAGGDLIKGLKGLFGR